MPLRCLRAVPFSQLANQGPSKLFGPHRRQPTLGTTGGGVTGGLHRGLRLRQAPRDRGAVERAAEAPKQPPPKDPRTQQGQTTSLSQDRVSFSLPCSRPCPRSRRLANAAQTSPAHHALLDPPNRLAPRRRGPPLCGCARCLHLGQCPSGSSCTLHPDCLCCPRAVRCPAPAAVRRPPLTTTY